MQIRLQKYLADHDIASRRKCEEYIQNGFITVNGIVIAEFGTKVDPEKDEVCFKGKIIENKSKEYVYILLNKPIRLCNNST